MRMKKLAMVIEFVGAAIFFLCMCADATENPIVAIPTIISLLLLYAGSRIEGGWQDAEEIVEDHDYYVDGDDTDDGITYITYDSNGTEHESSGQADVENGGCKGLMQIYEKYHRDRMERLGVEDLYDPYGNILVGCDYLAELFEKYEGDMSTVLMIYSGTSDAFARTYENRTEYAKSIMNRTVELERLHEETESDFGEGL